MNKRKVILAVLFVLLILEITVYWVEIHNKKKVLHEEFELQSKYVELNHEEEKQRLTEEFEQNKYLATGKDVYERIYNRPNQSIIELIERIAKEAFPTHWECDVKVEEFTDIILLIRTPLNESKIDTSQIAKYLIPVIKYTDLYLSNVCVFDRNHRCCLFYDKKALLKLKNEQKLSKTEEKDIQQKGKNFSRYNSVRIELEKVSNHFILPVEVVGVNGVEICVMMLDTGASTTFIPVEVAMKTGGENLNNVLKESFSTANGVMSCPIVERRLVVENIETKLRVAIDMNNKNSLLGMDFFSGCNYILDSNSNCIYIWDK